MQIPVGHVAVSYTHLDVYKRQLRDFVDSYFEPGTYVIVEVFADDGLTGTDTARPNFKRLEGCIVRKEVNFERAKNHLYRRSDFRNERI